ncbi:MAG: DUF1611 domain-containing protein [Candidatus Neomarinimicrobiota bacterium]|nr:MAG: DUF1611 domain-containing protein [Candidatus Neomarinimicrobiota bacterium]
MPSYAILCPGAFNYILNKTGNMLIRYFPDQVVAVIDPDQAGKTAQDVLGYGGDIPVVPSVREALPMRPDTLLIGNAPQGGKFTDRIRTEIIAAIQGGCTIVSGMHTFMQDDPELSSLAQQYQVRLVDLRRPPRPPHFPRGSWKTRSSPVLLVVGTDCDTGKMTTAWEITIRLRNRGRKVAFVGTGQTGILLGGQGVPVDAVVADFMAGEVEYVLDQQPPDTDLIVVEGQGALNNMFYSGVTLGLLHGAMPDWLVMTHEPVRKLDVTDYPMIEVPFALQLHLDLMRPFKQARFLGANLLTFSQTEEDARRAIQAARDAWHLPVTDLIRFGDGDLIEAIDKEITEWKSNTHATD